MKQKARTEARDMPQSVHSTVGSSSFLMFLNESNAFIFKNALQFVNLWMRGIDSTYSRSYQYVHHLFKDFGIFCSFSISNR